MTHSARPDLTGACADCNDAAWRLAVEIHDDPSRWRDVDDDE
jgi:hypothetical protein